MSARDEMLSRLRSLERRLKKIEDQTARLPVRIRGGGAGSATGTIWYLAKSKGDLPAASSVPVTALGRITDGDQKGAIFVIGFDGSGDPIWVGLNIWE